jgi:hypothetical protein
VGRGGRGCTVAVRLRLPAVVVDTAVVAVV